MTKVPKSACGAAPAPPPARMAHVTPGPHFLASARAGKAQSLSLAIPSRNTARSGVLPLRGSGWPPRRLLLPPTLLGRPPLGPPAPPWQPAPAPFWLFPGSGSRLPPPLAPHPQSSAAAHGVNKLALRRGWGAEPGETSSRGPIRAAVLLLSVQIPAAATASLAPGTPRCSIFRLRSPSPVLFLSSPSGPRTEGTWLPLVAGSPGCRAGAGWLAGKRGH